MKRLVVVADDLGLLPGMNAGAVRAHRVGLGAGVSSVAELAAAEPAELAAASGIGEARIRDFVAGAAEVADHADDE